MSGKREVLVTDPPDGALDGSTRDRRARRIAIRIVYGLMSLWTLTMSLGVVAPLTGSLPDGPYAFVAAGTTAWKLLSLGGYLVLMWTGGRSVVAAQWVLVGQLTWLAADLMAPQDASEGAGLVAVRYLLNTAIFLGPWFLLAPERWGVLHLRARPDWAAIVIVAVCSPALVMWARQAAALDLSSVAGGSAAEVRFDAVGLALVLGTVGAFASLRPSGRRWPLGVVAAGALYVGVDVLATDPADLASPGVLGGGALVVVGVGLAWRASRPLARGLAAPVG